MVCFNKKNLLQIPSYINFFYNKRHHFFILKFNNKLKLFYIYSFFYVLIFKTKCFFLINQQFSNFKFLYHLKLLLFKIKQFLHESEIKNYKKLKLLGIGYKIFPFKNFLYNIFLLKLGFSHNIFLKLDNNIFSFCLKFTNIFIISDDINIINKTCSLIQSFKLVNIFNGKGFLIYNINPILKKSKKS